MHSNSSPEALPAPPGRNDAARLFVWTMVSLACLIAWDVSGLDRTLAHVFGDGQGFPWRSNWVLVHVMHEGARRLAWVGVLILVVAVWWPFGVLRAATRLERVELVLSTMLALAVITALKYGSNTSCPWDLAEFGGVARYASHWALGVHDGGAGKCFPGGHASAGFAFVSGYFALRTSRPRAARVWLACALGAGLVLGFAQQMRGAHFQSHTLWTGWLCWTCAWLFDIGIRHPWRASRWRISALRLGGMIRWRGKFSAYWSRLAPPWAPHK